MGRFYPLYILRSDGMLETVTKHGGRLQKEANKPTPKQLDDKPKADGVKDYYREVAIDEPKHMDWRRKLAAMLSRELEGLDQEKGYILASFPENYRLYEHVKTAKKGDGEPKTKTHAGGGNERQDAYLYGHPLGRKKRYRSPGDFFPHLLWLATEGKGDPDDCGCKICCPEELDASMKEKEQMTQPLIVRRPSTSAKPSTTPTPGPTPAPNTLPARTAAQPVQLAASPAPTAQSVSRTPSKPIDYDIDSRYDLFLFRQGEMVWFARSEAWGLGIILERWKVGPQSHYTIQPLSYPDHQTRAVEISSDNKLRPWLAWTVPPFTHDVLNQASISPNYNTFNFSAMLAGDYGKGNPEIDASIMAARVIDATYTPFAPESRSESQSTFEVRWGGMFLGGEKIWVNDPVRLVLPAGQAATRVLVVRAIVERTQKSAQAWPSLSIVGDVYVMLPFRPVTMNQAPNGIVSGSDTVGLPSRMIEDVRRRNLHTIPPRAVAHYWKLLQKSGTFELKDIRGRWYETTLFLPILLQGSTMSYEDRVRDGEIPEVLSMMNGRSDCNTKDGNRIVPDARVQKREQAFGRAVPAHTAIVDGVKQTQQLPPQQQQQSRVGPSFQGHGAAASNAPSAAAPQQQEQHAIGINSNPGTGFEEFMDLDGLSGADIMSGFDQSYV